MLVTVAICTWNRADLLDRVLDEMRKLAIPPGVEWELLVVNNNCTDNTDEILRRHCEHLPIRRLFEERQGLSHARNCAVAAADGELLLWTDDDVLVATNWLAEYVKVAGEYPDVSFFGGPTEPFFLRPPADWFVEVLPIVAGSYAIYDLGNEPRSLDYETTPVGANFAVRNKVQKRYLYDVQLGRKKEQLMSGEESQVVAQMLDDGLKGRWVPTAKVRHCIPEDRQTTKYIRGYFFCRGKLDAMQARDRQEHQDLRSRLWLLRQVLKHSSKYCARRLLQSPQHWIRDMTQSCYFWGRLLG